MPTFPTEPLGNLRNLSMHDVTFTGNLNSSNIFILNYFSFTYSSRDLISDYQIDFGTHFSGKPNFIITANNIYNTNTLGFYNSITIILGKYFNQATLNNLTNIKTNTLSLSQGFYYEPISFTGFGNIDANNIEFNDITFNYGANDFMNFTNLKTNQILFNNCSGLTDSENNLKIVPNSLKFFAFINSNLSKLPSTSFFKNMWLIDLSNNSIQGNLPPINEPNDINSVLTFNFSGNKLSGTIPNDYCYHYLDISNNKLSGDLPNCFLCHLNDYTLRDQINGNSFNNYISNSSGSFPACSGIEFIGKPEISMGIITSIDGKLLGWNSNNPINQGKSIISTPEITFTLQIPNKRVSISGIGYDTFELLKKTNFKTNVLFKVPGINLTLEFDVSHPTTHKVDIAPYLGFGYKFTLYGFGYSSVTNYDQYIWVDSFQCSDSSSNTNLVNCIVYQPQLAEKEYIITILNNQTGLTGTYKYKFERTYPYISSINPPKKIGGIVSLFGSFGPKHELVSVVIADQDCPILSVDSFLITCTIGPGNGVNSVYLIVDGSSWNGIDIFKYSEDLQQCPIGLNLKECSGNGLCDFGYCFCFEGFVGQTCSFFAPPKKELTIKKNDTLTEIINNGYSFGFSITDIKEIDFSGAAVRQHNFTSWDLSDDSTIEKWTYINKFENAEISYTIERVLNVAKNFSFAGEIITVQPGSLKLTASINNWEYLGSLNTLQLQIKSSVNVQEGENNKCKNQQQSNIKSNSGDGISINYITIEKDNTIFSGRFIDKVESDGRPTYSKVSLSEKSNDSVTVTLSLPYCKVCKIDPDFSVMISPSINSNCGTNPTNLKWVIPISIVLGFLGLFGIFALLFFLLRGRIYVSKKAGIILLKKSKKSVNTP